jgi:ATP-dependent DNA ligase
MALSVPAALEPMESEPVDALPAGKGWQYEPKWDVFRCIARKDCLKVDLRSRNTRPLGRYFPEVVATLAELPIERFVLDGELIIANQPFDTLQLRLHPRPAACVAALPASHRCWITVRAARPPTAAIRAFGARTVRGCPLAGRGVQYRTADDGNI